MDSVACLFSVSDTFCQHLLPRAFVRVYSRQCEHVGTVLPLIELPYAVQELW